MPGPATESRIHITGASGSGVSTLGQAVAAALCVPFVDTDDAFWMPTNPRFTTKRPVSERLDVLAQAQGPGGWVVAGSLCGWGDRAIATADLIVFLSAPKRQRIERLRRRERAWFGARIEPGGDMEWIHKEFLAWAAQYDDRHFTGRSRVMHETWLMEQTVPVLRLQGTDDVADLVAEVRARLVENDL
ncbi:MAG TPA: adenylate kinase [Rhodobacteraceae bacterium]|mgnify:CR=1 FL=1|nr:adenylate kinase [Paracoccaceae bacterium]